MKSSTALFCLIVLVTIAANMVECKDKASSEVLEVFILPHSHDDVGWLETISGYFKTFVHDIYSTAVEELIKNPARKFQSVEQAFFYRWWNQATPTQQSQVRQLIAEGRWEFTIGGWVMQDEACTDYIADINQIEEGHKFIYDTFGVKPRFSFQVDPFGAASNTPTQFAMTGFDAHIISRIDFQKKTEMQNNKQMQFIWRANPSLGKNQEIFTHLMDQYSYCSPFNVGVYWDGSDNPNPWSRNPSPPLDSSNIEYVAQLMVQNIKQRSQWFNTPHLLWPFGCDFQFFNSTLMFENMDKLIDYVNKNNPDLNLKYAVLSDYFSAIHNTNRSWPVRNEQDFFPYDDNAQSFWTGYFTSRNLLKGFARSRDNVIRTADALYTVATNEGNLKASEDNFNKLDQLRQALGEAQHHDAITGTEQPQVAEMYMEHLQTGTDSADQVATASVSAMLSTSKDTTLSMDPEFLVNNLKQSQPVSLVINNPLPWTISKYIAVNVTQYPVVVHDSKGNALPAQQNPAPEDNSRYNLFFYVTLPAMGYETVEIGVATSSSEPGAAALGKLVSLNELPGSAITNNNYNVSFDSTKGLLSKVINRKNNVHVELSQTYLEYHAYTGYGQASGNYIFRPDGPAHDVYDQTNMKAMAIVGPLVQEVRQNFDATHFQLYRVFSTPSGYENAPNAHLAESVIEVEHHVGPLDGDRSLITRFTTDLKTGGEFFTDDGGYQMQQRQYNPNALLPIPGNYYPMINTAYLNGSDAQLTVLSERPHGASSQTEGNLEVMLHRRETRDDGRGESIPMDDQSRIKPWLHVIIDSPENTPALRHKLSLMLNFGPTVMYTTTDLLSDEYTTSYTALNADFPDNVHLLSLKRWNGSDDLTLIRLYHMFESDEDPNLSKDTTLNLQQLFKFAKVTSLEEMNLSANMKLKDMNRWQWTAANDDLPSDWNEHDTIVSGDVDPTNVVMTAKNIRTFFMNK